MNVLIGMGILMFIGSFLTAVFATLLTHYRRSWRYYFFIGQSLVCLAVMMGLRHFFRDSPMLGDDTSAADTALIFGWIIGGFVGIIIGRRIILAPFKRRR